MTEPASSASAASIPDAPSFDLAASAGRTGAYAWVAARLYEVTGDWVSTTGDPWVKARLAEISARFAWQASEWVERLPLLREAPREEFVVAPGPRSVSMIDALADLGETGSRLMGLQAVTARLCAVLDVHGRGLDVVRDRSVGHTLGMVRRDLGELDASLSSIADHLVTKGTPQQALDEAFQRWRGRLAGADPLFG